MCGIVGIIGDMGKTERNILTQLLYADAFRGFDSTGIVSVGYTGNVRTFKKAVPAADFIDFKQFDDTLFGHGVIGHNRWKTKGSISHNNAHPFSHGDFHGVHNGTLRNQSLLPDSKNFEVDSENIYHSFNKIGIDETLMKVHGAFALAWYNDSDKLFQFIRNSERPLHYAWSTDRKHVYYASEAKMLEWILGRNNVAHEKVLLMAEHHLYSFKSPKVLNGTVSLSVQKKNVYTVPVTKNLPANNSKNKEKVTPINKAPSKGADKAELGKYLNKTFDFQPGKLVEKGHFGRDYYTLLPVDINIEINDKDLEIRCLDPRLFKDFDLAKKSGMMIRATLSSYADRNDNPTYITVISKSVEYIEEVEEDEEEDATFQGYLGEPLTEAEFKQATAKGCAWCGNPVVFTDHNRFISEDEFLCEYCKEMPMVKDYLEHTH